MEAISTVTLHQLWKTIDNAPSGVVAKLNDRDLVHWLKEQFEQSYPLPARESQNLQKYLTSRLQLIRDFTLD
ncbi:MAG: hypothetical protein AB4368_05830 [Xenococcaceae cyanobacterium]